MEILSKSKSGKLSVIFIVIVPLLFVLGMYSATSLYEGVSSGSNLIEDIQTRPLLSISMIGGYLFGLGSLITGLFSIFKDKERSILVFISTFVGAVLTFFLIGNMILG